MAFMCFLSTLDGCCCKSHGSTLLLVGMLLPLDVLQLSSRLQGHEVSVHLQRGMYFCRAGRLVLGAITMHHLGEEERKRFFQACGCTDVCARPIRLFRTQALRWIGYI